MYLSECSTIWPFIEGEEEGRRKASCMIRTPSCDRWATRQQRANRPTGRCDRPSLAAASACVHMFDAVIASDAHADHSSSYDLRSVVSIPAVCASVARGDFSQGLAAD